MAVTLNADPTSRAANSYVTLAMANAYFNERITSDSFNNSTDDNKKRALIEAAKRIDSYRFHGEKIWYKQIMEWPRSPYCKTVSGKADTGSTTLILKDADLANTDLYENLDWQYSGIRILDGTNQNEARLAASFDVTTGSVTIDSAGSTAFPSALDTTSDYWLIQEVPKEIRDAQCELAIWLIDLADARNTQVDPNIKAESIGDYSVTYRDETTNTIVPDFVRNMIDEYISSIGVMINSRAIN